MSRTTIALNYRIVAIATVATTSIMPMLVQAQSTTLPPARSYHVDQYGRQTRTVKERYSEDSRGEKQGMYLFYNPKGQTITKYTYLHGVKNGPAFFIGEDDFYSISYRPTAKFVGSFLNGKEEGWWDVYGAGWDGTTGALSRRMKYVSGALDYVMHFRNGKMFAIYKYENNSRNGLARIYGAAKDQYATGQCRDDKFIGTWTNAGLVDGNVVYKQGGKLMFDNGSLATVINTDGSTRSLDAEKQQRQNEYQRAAAAQRAVELDKRLRTLEPVEFGFYTDSYMLRGDGKKSLDTLAKQLNIRYRSPQYRVKGLCMSVHTTPLKGSANELNEKMLYILSLNRALVIKQYLLKQLEDKEMIFEVYPCGGNLSSGEAIARISTCEKVGEITILPTVMIHAKEAYEKLSAQYGVKLSDELIASTILQESILATIRAYFYDFNVREEMFKKSRGESEGKEYLQKVPSELWLLNLESGLPGNYSSIENTAQFRGKVEALFVEMNRKYTSSQEIKPSVLFTWDLTRRVK